VTPSEQKLYSALHRRTAGVTPELAAAMLRAFQRLREQMTEAALVRALALGFAERIVEQIVAQAILDVALTPLRLRLRESLRLAVPHYAKTLPPKVGIISGGFDILSPNVIDAVRELETRAMQSLSTDIRETVRAYVENGLRDGVSHRQIAKGLRDVIGLAPNQLQEVENYRRKLERAHETQDALDNKLRDRRYDKSITNARKTGTPLTKEQIDVRVNAYRKRRIAQNAEINARQMAVDAQKLANRLAWQTAADQGLVDRADLWKQRIGVDDDRERPEHRAINDQVRRFDEPYSNGEVVSGDSSWGCRCIDKYFVRAA
jgi:hypothetical protein